MNISRALRRSLVVGGLLVAPVATGASPAGAAPPSQPAVTTVTTKQLPNSVSSLPKATLDAGRKITTQAQLDAAPADVKSAVQTAVTEVHTVTKNSGLAGAMAPASGSVGAGCWYVTDSYSLYNVFGWTLVSASVRVNNWCLDGNSITSTPNTRYYFNTHWGWNWCGWQNQYADWMSAGWSYEGYGTATAIPGACVNTSLEWGHGLGVDVYGSGYYYQY